MDIIALCPLSIGGFAWQPRLGGHAYAVIAKATFQLGQGTAQLAELQDALVHHDGHWDDDPQRSVYVPSDMVPFKERADVTLVGDAYAPIAGGARRLTARLCVGAVDKRISVVCDRFVDEAGRIRLGKPFRRIALRHERAARGPANPVGTDERRRRQEAGETARRLPNLEPTALVADGAPACFGPLAARWPVRQQLLGAAQAAFADNSWRDAPLPADADATYFNEAPVDQRLDVLPAGVSLLLEHLHPHLPRLRCELPGVRPRAFFEGSGAAREVALCADSLWIDMTRSVCTVTWRGSFKISSPAERGRVLVALEQPGERLIWPDLLEMERTGRGRPSQPSAPSSQPLSRPSAPSSHPLHAAAPPSDSQVRRHTQPASRPEAQPVVAEYRLAAGAEHGDTQAIRGRIPSPPLPFRAPLELPAFGAAFGPLVARTASPAPAAAAAASALQAPSAQAPSQVPAAQQPAAPLASARSGSPWAGGLAQAHTALRPPPSPPPPSITPPPLMLVPPPPSAPSAPAAVATAAATPACRGPLSDGARVQLIGYQAAALPRVQAHFGPLAGEPDEDPLSRELREALGAELPSDAEAERRRVVRVMARGEATGPDAWQAAMADASDEDGVYEAPLTLTQGELALAFDEVQTLRATIACVGPYLKDNAELAAEVDMARELLDQGLADCPDVAEELTDRLVTGYQADARIDATKVAARIERMLLSRRHYQRRSLLGGSWLRALLHPIEGQALPCYVPEAFAEDIPLFSRFAVRVIGELHPQQDQYESSHLALRAVAIGRVIGSRDHD